MGVFRIAMNKKMMFMFLGIFIIALVSAAVLDARVNTRIDLSEENETIIREKLRVDWGLVEAPEINITVGNMTKYSDYIIVPVFQEGLINKKVRLSRYKDKNQTIEYNNTELRVLVDLQIERSLENYANAIASRTSGAEEEFGGDLEIRERR